MTTDPVTDTAISTRLRAACDRAQRLLATLDADITPTMHAKVRAILDEIVAAQQELPR